MSDAWKDHDDSTRRPANVAVPDGVLRFTVASRSRSGVKHLQELDAYNGHGECSCEDFQYNFGKYLKKGLTARQALEQGFIKELREYQRRPEDALSCRHILDARDQLADLFVAAVMKSEKARFDALRHAKPQDTTPQHGRD